MYTCYFSRVETIYWQSSQSFTVLYFLYKAADMFISIILIIGPERWCWETISPLYYDARMQTFCYKFVKCLRWVSTEKPLSLPFCFLNNDPTKTGNGKLIITKWPVVKVMFNITRDIKEEEKLFLNICNNRNAFSKTLFPVSILSNKK